MMIHYECHVAHEIGGNQELEKIKKDKFIFHERKTV